jgi:hypothetical protein
VHGASKTINGKKETWWWKDKVGETIIQKHTCLKSYKDLDNERKSSEVEKANTAYNQTKRLAKGEV